MIKNPKVSIIIPTYNRPRLFERALQRVQEQNYKNITEIIVTDDSTNDEVMVLVQEFARNDPRIIYIKNTKYIRGASGNRQNGIDYARGDFFAFADDDDELLPEAVSEVVQAYHKTGYRYIMANCRFHSDGRIGGKSYAKSEVVTFEDVLSGRYSGEYWDFIAKDLVKDIKMKDDAGGGETIFYWQILRKEPAYYLDKVLRVCHDDAGGNDTNNIFKKPKQSFLRYKYTVDIFGNDLLSSSVSRYRKIALFTSLFADLSNDRISRNKYFRLAWNSSVKNITIMVFSVLIFIPITKRGKIFLFKTAKRFYKSF